MKIREARIGYGWLPLVLAATAACGSSPTQPTSATTPPPAPQVVISAPTPVAPANGVTSSGWPTFIVTDSERTGPATDIVYRFDVAGSATFNPVIVTGTVSETAGQTSFAPPSNTPPPPQTALFWRAIAIDPIHIAASPPSTPQSFTYSPPPSAATALALEQGVTLWPGTQPPGTLGHAAIGNGWTVGPRLSFNGVTFLSPELEELRVFDMLDRGFNPQAALDWINGHGYKTTGAYYPAVSVIGFRYQYMASIGGRWDLVTKNGA